MYHILALIVVAIWGVTFVSTKILLQSGLTPVHIFIIRFLIAYVGISIFSIAKKRGCKLFAESLRDELLLALMGLSGGSLYFLTENSALGLTQATNVSFIVTVTPVLTSLLALLIQLITKGKQTIFTLFFAIGSALALVGVFILTFDGQRPVISPAGDMLALGAALCWAVYSNIMGFLKGNYGSVFITRKVFFYGLLTIFPFYLPHAGELSWNVMTLTEVWANLLFLGVVASLGCFVAWNKVLAKLGTVAPTNYLYLNPFLTMLTAVLVLGEKVTTLSFVGSVAIVVGVAVSQLGRK